MDQYKDVSGCLKKWLMYVWHSGVTFQGIDRMVWQLTPVLHPCLCARSRQVYVQRERRSKEVGSGDPIMSLHGNVCYSKMHPNYIWNPDNESAWSHARGPDAKVWSCRLQGDAGRIRLSSSQINTNQQSLSMLQAKGLPSQHMDHAPWLPLWKLIIWNFTASHFWPTNVIAQCQF